MLFPSRFLPYLQLLRLRTLPLAAAAVVCGSALAQRHGSADGQVLVLTLLTAVLLQIVSNIANDYGDGLRGTDRYRDAAAPQRVTASGSLPPPAVRRFLMITLEAALGCGLWLLAITLDSLHDVLLFLLLGAASAAAALGYTLGRHAYGYYALGEAAVFLCFGLLAVAGSVYLQTAWLPDAVWLPAAGCGLLAAAVLHTNNLRDIDGDRAAGKTTLAGLAGFGRGKWLYAAFVASGLLCYALYSCRYGGWWWLLCLPYALVLCRRIAQATEPAAAGRQLAATVRLHLATNLLFAAALFWSGG